MSYSICPECLGAVVHTSGFAHICRDLSPLEKENAKLKVENWKLKNLLERLVKGIRDLDPLQAAENYLEFHADETKCSGNHGLGRCPFHEKKEADARRERQ